MLVHMASIEVPRQVDAERASVAARRQCGALRSAGCTGQLAALRKRFLDLWLVCARTSVVLTNQKSLFP